MGNSDAPAKVQAKVEISDELVDEIAAEAVVCKPSVLRRLAGLKVRGSAGARVDRVIAMKGLRTG